jgi:hypothetical protein
MLQIQVNQIEIHQNKTIEIEAAGRVIDPALDSASELQFQYHIAENKLKIKHPS